MAISRGPKIVTNGLVLALDAADRNSYLGSGTTWTDLRGNNNTGVLTNGPTFNASNRGSISFDGINQCVVVNSNASILPTTAYTKVAWFYATNFATGNNIISGGNSGQHAFWLAGGNKLNSGHNGNWSTVVSTTTLSLNTSSGFFFFSSSSCSFIVMLPAINNNTASGSNTSIIKMITSRTALSIISLSLLP